MAKKKSAAPSDAPRIVVQRAPDEEVQAQDNQGWVSMLQTLSPEAQTLLEGGEAANDARVLACVPTQLQAAFLRKDASEEPTGKWWLVVVPDEGFPEVNSYRQPINVLKQLAKLDGKAVHVLVFFGSRFSFTKEPRHLVLDGETSLAFIAKNAAETVQLKDVDSLLQTDHFLGDPRLHKALTAGDEEESYNNDEE